MQKQFSETKVRLSAKRISAEFSESEIDSLPNMPLVMVIDGKNKMLISLDFEFQFFHGRVDITRFGGKHYLVKLLRKINLSPGLYG